MEKDSKLNELIYVVGHRNPDTDSIVSAIAYAEFKKKIGYTNIRAARAGILNFQTSYILNKLNVKPPVILNDIKTRVAEVMIRDIISIHNYEPLHNALVKFEKFGIRYLPVVDSEKKPEGLLTLSIVTNNLLKLFSSDKIITNINSICEVISGNLLNRCSDITKDEEFEIILTTGSINAFKKMISKNPDIPKIIITDDRYDLQRIACSYNSKAIILSENCPPSKTITKLASKKNITLISTSSNTSRIVFLLKQCIPVKYIYSNDFKTIYYKKTLEEARGIVEKDKVKGIMALDENGKLNGVITRSVFLRKNYKNIILVDHNEPTQTLEGINDVEILEIVDHHRISTFQTIKPITFINLPVGSASTIVAMQYRNSGVSPSAVIAKLLIAGILSDTVILKSPTTTDIDKKMIKWLNSFANIDYIQFAEEFFKAGSVINDKNIKDAVLSDFKTFDMNENKIGIGQIETVGMPQVLKYRKRIFEILNSEFKSGKFNLISLLVTDISAQSSVLFAITDDKIKRLLPWPELEKNIFDLKGILSRKKQVVPALSRLFV